jgi:hypothetical protein
MTPLEAQALSQTMTDVYEKMEYDLMMNVVRNIKNYDQITPTGQWQLQKLAESGKLTKQNIQIMADALGGTGSYFTDMITEAAMQTVDEIEPGYRKAVKDGILNEAVEPKKSPNIKQAMETYKKQAKDSFNLVNTTMRNNTKDMFVKLVNDTATLAEQIGKNQEAINVLNKSAGEVISGAESRQQALRKTIKEFNAKGITAFVDKAGKNWTPEAYTNMVLRSTVGSVANSTQLARADDYGVDYLEVSSHSGARPKCAKDQGKIFCISGKDKNYPKWSSSSYGDADGLLGINCGHSVTPFVPGVNIQRNFPQDEEENDEQYQKMQGQRAIEREVRKSKRELAMFDMLGDKEAFQEASVKLKAKEKKLSLYCKENNLPRRRNREQVDGFGKSTSAKAIDANKRR